MSIFIHMYRKYIIYILENIYNLEYIHKILFYSHMESYVKSLWIDMFQEFHVMDCLSDSRRKTSTKYYSHEILLTVTGSLFFTLWGTMSCLLLASTFRLWLQCSHKQLYCGIIEIFLRKCRWVSFWVSNPIMTFGLVKTV